MTLVTLVTRWGVALVLVVAGVAALAVGLPDPAPGARPVPGVATPLWSVRRVPGPVVDPLTAARSATAAALLQQALDVEADRYGATCFVVQRGSTVLASRGPDVPLIPASTQKLLVGAAALAALGPDFRFETRAVVEHRAPSVDRLWVVGSGDPVLRTAGHVDEGVSTPLDALADAIVAGGVQRIGALVGDDSRYDAQRYVPTWKPGYLVDLDVGPVGALVVDQGVTLASGSPALVDDPGAQVVAELAAALRARGVVVDGVGRGVAPAGAVTVGAATSQPLRTIVGFVLAVSDNLAAEMLTKELGVRLRQDGSTVAGVGAARDLLRGLGADLDHVTTVDGSGLDRGNRLSCSDLVSVLRLAARPDLAVLREVLPGDVRPNGDGRVRAKSGYLDDVTGIAGEVGSTSLTFAFLANGAVPAPARNAVVGLRRVADVLAGYTPPAPVPDALVPEPGTRSAR